MPESTEKQLTKAEQAAMKIQADADASAAAAQNTRLKEAAQRDKRMIKDQPDDALIEIPGEGLFVNGTGWPAHPVEVPTVDAAASESDNV